MEEIYKMKTILDAIWNDEDENLNNKILENENNPEYVGCVIEMCCIIRGEIWSDFSGDICR